MAAKVGDKVEAWK